MYISSLFQPGIFPVKAVIVARFFCANFAFATSVLEI